MSNNIETGQRGEALASDYLKQKGYVILQTNFTCRQGEIDIIARDNEYIVFVEVKLRRNLSRGYPREAVGPAKQRKIRQVSLYYISCHSLASVDFRFDVIEILDMNGITIEHIENAF